jgi:hypothetical protein
MVRAAADEVALGARVRKPHKGHKPQLLRPLRTHLAAQHQHQVPRRRLAAAAPAAAHRQTRVTRAATK